MGYIDSLGSGKNASFIITGKFIKIMVFQKILVALDRSLEASVVLEQALNLSQQGKSTLMLFNCLSWEEEKKANPLIGIGTLGDINIYSYPKLDKLGHESLQKDIEQVQEWLTTLSKQVIAKDMSAEIDCRVGVPGSWICDRAKSWDADLIVLGRRGHTGLSELLLGSVSNYVVHHAPCSVLVVQQHK